MRSSHDSRAPSCDIDADQIQDRLIIVIIWRNMNDTIQVICLGSWHGSDAAAWALADRLEGNLQPGFELHRCAAPVQMFELIKPGAIIYVIDATPDLPVGQVTSVAHEDLLRAPRCSSHGLDLLAALELVDALGDSPCELHILALGVGTAEMMPEAIAELALPPILEKLRQN